MGFFHVHTAIKCTGLFRPVARLLDSTFHRRQSREVTATSCITYEDNVMNMQAGKLGAAGVNHGIHPFCHWTPIRNLTCTLPPETNTSQTTSTCCINIIIVAKSHERKIAIKLSARIQTATSVINNAVTSCQTNMTAMSRTNNTATSHTNYTVTRSRTNIVTTRISRRSQAAALNGPVIYCSTYCVVYIKTSPQKALVIQTFSSTCYMIVRALAAVSP